MKLKTFWAMVALMCMFTAGVAQAAPVQQINSGWDFVPSSALEEIGTQNRVVFGSSSRGALVAVSEFGVYTTSDDWSTNPPTWTPLTGVVGYTPTATGDAIVVCPPSQTCGGYKAFYMIWDSTTSLYRCTGFSGSTLSGCSQWSVTDMDGYSPYGTTLDQTGNNLIVGGGKASDSHSQIYSIDIATSTATKLTACSDPNLSTSPLGSIVGNGTFTYLYVSYNGKYWRYNWNGSTCTGARVQLSGAMGYDNAVNTGNANLSGAVGNLTGTFYFMDQSVPNDMAYSKLNATCNDSFVSGTEDCDTNAADPLNGQSCSSVPGGFTGGSLACTLGTCVWDTSSCTLPSTCPDSSCNNGETCETCPADCGGCCGNSTIEVGDGEVCDITGPNLGGNTCASVMGAGYTGTLGCAGDCQTFNTSACVAPPVCGDLVCNGTDTCSNCPGDCGQCCGNNAIDPGEDCDGGNLNGADCSTVLGQGYTGSLSCTACSFNTGACVAPPTCNNGILDPGEECDTPHMNGATCTSEKGAGWTGSVSCQDCQVVTTACVFDWGLKNLIGDCGKTGEGIAQQVEFTGSNTCTGEYWPIGAANPTNLKWVASAGKVLVVGVMADGQNTVVNVPQGVNHEEIDDNGHKWTLAYGAGAELGPEGTFYSAVETVWPNILVTCTEDKVYANWQGNPYAFTVPGEAQGKLPEGWAVEINVLNGDVITPPYELGSGGTGGAGGEAGSAGAGGEGGAGDAGTPVAPPPSGGGDDGGCSTTTCNAGGRTSNGAYLLLALVAAMAASRRRKF